MSSGGGKIFLFSSLLIRPLQPLHREILPKMNAIQNWVSSVHVGFCSDEEGGVDEAHGDGVHACVGISGGGIPTVRFMAPLWLGRRPISVISVVYKLSSGCR